MKATATQIGNSKKESVDFNGKTFLKSVVVGKWNYIVTVQYEGDDHIYTGKSATRENAAKWVPGVPNPVFCLMTASRIAENTYAYPGGIEDYRAKLAAFKAEHPDAIKKRHRFGASYYIAPLPTTTRKIFKIER